MKHSKAKCNKMRYACTENKKYDEYRLSQSPELLAALVPTALAPTALAPLGPRENSQGSQAQGRSLASVLGGRVTGGRKELNSWGQREEGQREVRGCGGREG